MFARRPLGGFLVLLCAGSLVLSLLILYYAPVFREWMLAAAPARPAMAGDAAAHKKEVERIQGRIRNLQKKYAAITPRKPYLVVDTSNNKFRLMSGDKLIREGTCSTGSYVLLKAGDDRQWVFKTPRGRFHVQTKKESPVWYKPDWAFVEEGLPIPPPHSQERYEAGVLGDYALHIGDGYLIHGTLYKRLLGMPVTHGCVRLGDEDLEVVYKNLQVGSPVYIY
ncbi:MAG: L,D-transpeptidase [Chitinivibrionia bacterium]|nr:L,D-transpeptidase [Chitinivibrionia bacterium]